MADRLSEADLKELIEWLEYECPGAFQWEYLSKIIPKIERLMKAEKDWEEKFNQAKYYSPFQAKPCPLCKYENGIFIMHCNYHENIHFLEKEIKELKVKLAKWLPGKEGRELKNQIRDGE